jgi:hypothetical protein
LRYVITVLFSTASPLIFSPVICCTSFRVRRGCFFFASAATAPFTVTFDDEDSDDDDDDDDDDDVDDAIDDEDGPAPLEGRCWVSSRCSVNSFIPDGFWPRPDGFWPRPP